MVARAFLSSGSIITSRKEERKESEGICLFVSEKMDQPNSVQKGISTYVSSFQCVKLMIIYFILRKAF